ncbi:fatty acid desaturase [Paucibacter sp. KCTC 42545]|uniref:fatty acid desaturase n=1 Tax=Paucibacter sp. KCTC 42545 TaxID=1768242 RepID=UPI000733A2E5|nr:fatty acid desaturase [Paucibacter sp. KCTC 42545]ALT75939.1 flavodoxin reductase [Paucibacter sp. KCTC 42545]
MPLKIKTAPKPAPHVALINATHILVQADETLLQAALRQGVEMPYSCRVGGCASCKCKLTSGQVKQLTETSYLLSDEDLDAGMILACQSIPLSDVRIELAPLAQAQRQRVAGHVIAQERLTHDITRLRIQLAQRLSFQAGQFAELSLAALPGMQRSYSFAAPCRDDGQVEFFVRQVPGGAFSTLVNQQELLGQSVQIEGPLGHFTLRPADAPLLMVAGGSGLAPVLAILQEALATGVTRSVTLLFGARKAKDLYALDEIAELAALWPAAFNFVPVLSEPEPEANEFWTGARGLITEHLLGALLPGAHAYLCGPPAMIDAAAALLQQHGVAAEHIHADRFTTQHNAAAGLTTAAAASTSAPASQSEATTQRASIPAPAATTPASVLDYLKYALFHAVGLSAAAALLAGGSWITLCLLTVLGFYIVGDAVLGEDSRTPQFKYPGLLTAQLWLALPLLLLICFAAVWGVSAGDPLGFGAWLSGWSGYDLLAARAATAWPHHVSAAILTGLMIGMVGTITAHELTHRTWDPVSMGVGRWLLAFSFDTIFAIEHVYGHHRYVSTIDDPATAPRGRNVYAHVLISTVRGNVSAWQIETRSLRRRGLPRFGLHNAVIRGHLMSLGLVALAWVMGGAAAAGFFVLCALWGKALLEIVNYMEHYGMVRDPATPVQPRHSWNTTKRISSWSMFNLTRHSHHHAQGEVPFHELQPLPDSPQMISGYLTTIVVALIPPLWHALMAPKLREWDSRFASEDERDLARRANARIGLAPFA